MIQPSPPPDALRLVRNFALVWLAPLLISLAFSIACYYVAGHTLGLFIGGLACVTLLAPQAVLGEYALSTKVQAAAASIIGATAAWRILLWDHTLLQAEFFRCELVLIAYTIALSGVAMLLRALHLSTASASAIVVALALAWLTWPVWMAPRLHGEDKADTVARLTRPHPIFAINQTLARPLPDKWQESKLLYSLVSIGQHVSFSPPSSILPCVAWHALIGMIAALLAAIDPIIRRPDTPAALPA